MQATSCHKIDESEIIITQVKIDESKIIIAQVTVIKLTRVKL